MSVCTNVKRPYLIAAVDQISGGKHIGLLQKVVQVKDHDTPAVVLELQRNLDHEPILGVEVLEQIADRDSDSMGSLGHTQIDVVTKWKSMARAFHLKIDVSACEAESLDVARRVRQLHVIVS